MSTQANGAIDIPFTVTSEKVFCPGDPDHPKPHKLHRGDQAFRRLPTRMTNHKIVTGGGIGITICSKHLEMGFRKNRKGG